MNRAVRVEALAIVAVAGLSCGSSPQPPCSVEVTDPSVPGSSVHIAGDRCVVRTGQPHMFRYRTDVRTATTYVSPDSAGACSRCGGYTEDPLTLVDTAVTDGGAVKYCMCDLGCCGPTVGRPVTVPVGDASGELLWPGVQWSGPSDTNNSLGPPFPAGKYFVQVMFRVPGVGAVDGRLPIVVTE